MDTWIVVCTTQYKLTRAFTNERKAQAYYVKLERNGDVCRMIETKLNRESIYVSPRQK